MALNQVPDTAESSPKRDTLFEQLGGKNTSLREGSIARQLIRLTIPMLLGISSMMVASLIDVFYVGQIGTLETAALTLTFPLVMGFASLSMGFGIGATSIISRTVGAGDWAKAQRVATHTLVLVAGFVAVVVAVGFIFTEPIYLLLNANEELLPIAIKYTHISLIGVPVLAIPMVGGMMLRSFNDVVTPATIMVAGAVVQVIIAPVLIWGIGSWEGWGVYGSAWSFVLSRLVVAVYALYMFHVRGFFQPIGSYESFRASVFEVMRLALPSIASQLLMPFSMYLVMMLVARYDNHVIAAFGIVTRIESLALIVVMALSSSMGPFVGQNFGAQRFDRIKSALSMSYRFCWVWGVVLAVLFALFGGTLAGLFRDDPEVVQVAAEFFLIVPITLGLMGLSMISGSTFVAYGYAMPSMIMSIGRMFVILIPLCYLLDWIFEYRGIFIAIALTNVISGIVAYYWLASRTRYHERLVIRKPSKLAADV